MAPTLVQPPNIQPTYLAGHRIPRPYRRAAVWGFIWDAMGTGVMGTAGFFTILIIGALIQSGVALGHGNHHGGTIIRHALDLPTGPILIALLPCLILLLAIATAFTNAYLCIGRAISAKFAAWPTPGQGYLASVATWATLLFAGFIATQLLPGAVGHIAMVVFHNQLSEVRIRVTDSEMFHGLLGYIKSHARA